MHNKTIILRLICLFLISIPNLQAQNSEDRPKVGLVLSGGGAKGFAHVGVLKVLEEYNIPIDYIGGTSIGSIVGGLYAIGYSSDQLEDMILSQNWEALFVNEPDRKYMPFYEKEEKDRYLISIQLVDKKFQIPNYALDNDGIIKLFSDLTIGYHEVDDFNALPIPFLCVAVDLLTGKEAVINTGSLPEAMGASMAIPGVFPSVKKDSAVYVDGGVRNNFPVDHVRAMGADIIIGIDIGAGLGTREDLEKIGGVIDQLTSLLGEDKIGDNIADCDYYIKPDISEYSSSDFTHDAAIELLKVGEEAGEKNRLNFEALEKQFSVYDIKKVKQFKKIESLGDKYVTEFNISGTRLAEDEVLGILGLNKDEERICDFDQIQVGLERLHSSMKFSTIRYEIIEDTMTLNYSLNLELEDYANSTINFGAHFNTQENVALLFNGTFNTLFLSNSRVSADLKIAETPAVNIDYNINRGSLPGLGIKYAFRGRVMESYLDGNVIGEADVKKHSIEINTNSVIEKNFTVGLGVKYDHFKVNDVKWVFPLDGGKYDYILYKFFFELDTRNKAYYPTRGVHYSLSTHAVTDNGYNFNDDAPAVVAFLSTENLFSVNSIWTVTPLACVQFQFSRQNAVPIFYDAYAGGVYQPHDLVTQVPFWGLRWGEYRSSNLLMFGVENRVRVGDKHYVYGNVNVMATSDKLSGLTSDDMTYKIGGSVGYSYDSLVGPIDVFFSAGSDDTFVGFLNIGYYF